MGDLRDLAHQAADAEAFPRADMPDVLLTREEVRDLADAVLAAIAEALREEAETPPWVALRTYRTKGELLADVADRLTGQVEQEPSGRLPHAGVPGLTPETCPERGHHGNPFRYCPVKGCGWHEGMT